MAATRPAVEDGQHGSREGGDDSRRHEPQDEETGYAAAAAGKVEYGSADRCGRSGWAAGRRNLRGPQSAARSSAQSEKPDWMQKRLVLVEYGKRWYGTRQPCLMRWAGGDSQRGVETDRGR